MWISGALLVCFSIVLSNAVPLEPSAKPADATPVPIIAQAEEFEDNGGFKYSFETGNGIKVEEMSFNKVIPFARTPENANLKDAPDNVEVRVQQGSYSYIAPDGNTISLRYVADENGFQPVGEHLPTPPPIPEAILRSLSSQSDVEAVPHASSNVVISVPKEESPAVNEA